MDEKIDPKTRLAEDENRNIPPALKKLLHWDVVATKKFVSFLLNFVAMRSLKNHCKFLEYSCHGVVWLTCWLAFCWTVDSKDLYQMQINMLVGLLLDIVFVALIKASTRRRRPTINDDPFCIGPDKFSFPSGHASRATYIMCFFLFLHPLFFIFWAPVIAWTASICLSRLLMYRHHILDVLGGMTLGVFEAFLLSILWLNQESCVSLMNWMTDEKLSGAEFGV